MQVIERSKPKKKSMFASPKVENQQPIVQFPVEVDAIQEDESENYPLFKAFPGLKDFPKVKLIKTVPHVRKIPNYAEMISYSELYIKKDDTINDVFGGIMIRKLEYILGQAKSLGCQTVHCFGYLGSELCVAVAAHARNFGLKPKISLCQCTVTDDVQLNLKLIKNFEPYQLELISEAELAQLQIKANQQTEEIMNRSTNSISEFLVPFEGNAIYAQLGLVNAIYELEVQIAVGDASAPGAIFFPCQSTYSAGGILLGLVLAKLDKTMLYAVQCSKDQTKNEIINLAFELYNWMKIKDPSVKTIERNELEKQLLFIPGYFGGDQNCLTIEAEEIKKQMAKIDFINLDSQYTAKTFSAMAIILTKLQTVVKDKIILFWNTYGVQWNQFKDLIVEPSEFKQEFQEFFKEELLQTKPVPAGSIAI